jgi:hypothetical protein
MRTRFLRKAALLLAMAALAALPGFAGIAMGAPALPAAPAENWEARSRLSETIFAPVRSAAGAGKQVIPQSSGAPQVMFRTETQSGALYLVFANRTAAGFPLDGAGTFIVKRSLADGSFVQAKVFVQDGPGTYIRLFPEGERTFMDVFLFGELFQTRIALPVSFDRLLVSPLASIVEWSAPAVNWPLVLAQAPGPGDRRIETMVQALKARLPALRDMDDGAMDGAGRLVSIATGNPAVRGGFNCSGFAKWVVDGLYAPLAGKPMGIEPLKSRNAGRNNPWSTRFEEELDPWFGLDWSRGLARTIAEARTGASPSDAQIDVRNADRLPYVRDVGYPVSRLEYLLYFLARENPGRLYVGSVNAPSALAVSEGTPTLRQHHHVIILLPYFDGGGAFRVAVMERNLQTSLASLTRRYGREYVHLVRIDAEGTFSPPKVN